jgi:hypothetical protein
MLGDAVVTPDQFIEMVRKARDEVAMLEPMGYEPTDWARGYLYACKTLLGRMGVDDEEPQTPVQEGRIITRTMTDGIRTKDGVG